MKLVYSLERQSHTISLDRRGGDVQVDVDGASSTVRGVNTWSPRVTFFYKDKPVTAYVIPSGTRRWVHINGKTIVLTRGEPGARRAHAGGAHGGTSSGIIVAPMPGQVRAVLVQVGETVTEAQPLLILEAMKMELKVLAPYDGVISGIHIVQGASVERDQILGEIKERT